jgi:hypothetical protein
MLILKKIEVFARDMGNPVIGFVYLDAIYNLITRADYLSYVERER